MNKPIRYLISYFAVLAMLTLSSSALADIRFGFGASGIASDSGDYQANTSVKAELGLDINNMWGIHGSYEKLDGDYKAFDFDGGVLKVGLDLGYKFELAIFDLKPYAKAGASFVDVNTDSELSELIDDGASAYYGVGVRGSITVFYLDVALEQQDTGFGGTEGNGSITVGFVF